jgi:hypothetical protein
MTPLLRSQLSAAPRETAERQQRSPTMSRACRITAEERQLRRTPSRGDAAHRGLHVRHDHRLPLEIGADVAKAGFPRAHALWARRVR